MCGPSGCPTTRSPGSLPQRAEVTLDGTVTDDPRLLHGRFGDEALVRLEVTAVTSRDRSLRLRQPVVVFGATSWLSVPLGAAVRVRGHLSASTRGDVAAGLSTRDPPTVTAGPDPWWRASARVRAALRESVSGLPPDRRALVPALVDGDDAGLDPALQDDFRTTGLTHLLAVSGTNLTLVVGFALVVARWLRVRGRWLYVVGAAGIAGFVLVARAEPSVLRAAVMGTVALVGMGANGRDRGTRALGVATLLLLLLDPGLASAIGFGLSVLATAGILLLAPAWRDALARWLPRWLAEAVAVPTAAQLACTPLVAAISGQVSLVAVLANLLAAPVVGPATVLGLLGGLVTLVAPPLGRLAGSRGRVVRRVDRRGRPTHGCPAHAGDRLGERPAGDRRARGGEPPRWRCTDLAWCDVVPPGWRAAASWSRPSWCGSRRPDGRRTGG